MAAGWFCELLGKEVGPLSLAQLKAMLDSGRLTPQHVVKKGSAGAWLKIGLIPELTAAAEQPAPLPTLPPRAAAAAPRATVPQSPTVRSPSVQSDPAGQPGIDAASILQEIAELGCQAVPATKDKMHPRRMKQKRHENAFLITVFAALVTTLVITLVVFLVASQSSATRDLESPVTHSKRAAP
jgi:hypothetical protein